MKTHVLTLVFLIGILGISHAGKAPIKFGEVSKAELINNVYTADTSAPAIILCDYGYFTSNLFETVRILRIKILKKEGYDWANRTFNTDSKTDIRGITYNLENDKIVETKLKKESIFSTKVSEDRNEIRIAMSNVRVGSVIDIEFRYLGIPYEWDFQQEIPVVHSELEIEPSIYVTYNKNFYGYIGLTSKSNNRWVAQNMPAFKPEPFMTSSKNYRTRFEFDYESISFPGYYKGFTTTWNAVRDRLYEATYFGIALNADGYMKSVAKDMKARCSDQKELIKMAYDYIKQIKWDETERLFTDRTSLNAAVKDGKGNSAEINLALIQLLKKLDFDAGPVVMSTRENGRVSAITPSLNKLNYVIAAVFLDNDTILLDATEKNCPYNMVPLRVLNGQAQFIDKTRTGWIQLATDKKDKQMIAYNLSVEEDLSIKGKIVYSIGDYAALDFRNNYEEFNSDDEYLTDFKDGKKGLKIISHKIDNLDSIYKAINEEFDVVIKNSVTDIDGDLYIVPVLFEQMKENPFKVADRQYPIDFGYAHEKSFVINYTLPKGYTVVSLPANISLKLPNNSALFSCKSNTTEGKVTLVYKLNINNSLILPTEYKDLREFFNQIIAKQAEPIVLKKI